MFVFLYQLIKADTIMILPGGEMYPKPNGPYKGIADQDPNQQQESNLTNQQDEFNANDDKGGRVPLWPCRAGPGMETPNVYQRNQTVQVQWQSNNMHASIVEINVFTNNGQMTRTLYGPAKTMSGFARGGFPVTIPSDLPPCAAGCPCFLQYYVYSMEPRNYVTCSDFIIQGDVCNSTPTPTGAAQTPNPAAQANPLVKRQLTPTLQSPPVAGTQVVEAPGMKPVTPYDDAAFYESTSTNYEAYAGQVDPNEGNPLLLNAIKMWNITAPGEAGSKASGEEKAAADKNRKMIVTLTKQAESVVNCADKEEAKQMKAQIGDVKKSQDKGDKDENGYYPAAAAEAYDGGIAVGKPLDGAPANMILSDPSGRQYTTTYTYLDGKCIDALDAAVKTMVAGQSDIETQKQAVNAVCQQEVQAQRGIFCPGDQRTEAEKEAENKKRQEENEKKKAEEDAKKKAEEDAKESEVPTPIVEEVAADSEVPVLENLPAEDAKDSELPLVNEDGYLGAEDAAESDLPIVNEEMGAYGAEDAAESDLPILNEKEVKSAYGPKDATESELPLPVVDEEEGQGAYLPKDAAESDLPLPDVKGKDKEEKEYKSKDAAESDLPLADKVEGNAYGMSNNPTGIQAEDAIESEVVKEDKKEPKEEKEPTATRESKSEKSQPAALPMGDLPVENEKSAYGNEEIKVEEAKKEEPKVEEVKVEEPKKEKVKVEELKVEEPKKEEPKIEEVKVEEPKKEKVKVEEMKVEPKKEEMKVEEPKKEEPKKEEPKEEVKVEEPKAEPKKEEPKKEGGASY